MSDPAAAALEALYHDVVAHADRARAWFDGPGVAWRAGLPPVSQAEVAIESLAITGRLMFVMSWLLDPAHLHGGAPRAFAPPAEPPLPPASPLLGTPGGEIAEASRRLVAKAGALAAQPRLPA